jgi:hypothetical protein
MLKNIHEIKKITVNSLTTTLLLITSTLIFTSQAIANDLSNELTPPYSVSQGALKIELSDEERQAVIDVNKHANTSDKISNIAMSRTREEILNSNTAPVNKSSKRQIAQRHSQYYNADFAIYSATTFLIDDFDADGFYQTFSVAFDADIYSYTYNQVSEVYALLYLSKNGGPWRHYFTTDDFLIEGESDLDEYEVITTFRSGYRADYYDVLIDLYQVGYSDIVATYSSDDSNALYALPLESANYDEPYIEVVEVYGGSFSVLTLILILMFSLLRYRSNTSFIN